MPKTRKNSSHKMKKTRYRRKHGGTSAPKSTNSGNTENAAAARQRQAEARRQRAIQRAIAEGRREAQQRGNTSISSKTPVQGRREEGKGVSKMKTMKKRQKKAGTGYTIKYVEKNGKRKKYLMKLPMERNTDNSVTLYDYKKGVNHKKFVPVSSFIPSTNPQDGGRKRKTKKHNKKSKHKKSKKTRNYRKKRKTKKHKKKKTRHKKSKHKKSRKNKRRGGSLSAEERKEMNIGRPDGCSQEEIFRCMDHVQQSLLRRNINIIAQSIDQLGVTSDRPNETYEDFMDRFLREPGEKERREFILDILHDLVLNDPEFNRRCLQCPIAQELNLTNPTGSQIDAILIRLFPFLNPYTANQVSRSPAMSPSDLYDSGNESDADDALLARRRPMLRQSAVSGYPSDDESDSGSINSLSDLHQQTMDYENSEDSHINIPRLERQATVGTNLMDAFNEVDGDSNNGNDSDSDSSLLSSFDSPRMSVADSQFTINSGRENLSQRDRNVTQAMWDFDSQMGVYFLVDPTVMPEHDLTNTQGQSIELNSLDAVHEIPFGHIPSAEEVRRLNEEHP